ncbi:hypothetical protein ACFQRL_00915 [Microbacterium fluvii]|uniref:GGDEF domain-containing protein n=1 Tax=Microbacterium fluvii TaxID=415215 RepID=A0ABW2HCP5_9MICO|nr:hypothetical protein [Microbacterium fluvii]MCU4671147.1 hypothetical protein [Microbacterium fluvii]
MINTGLGVMLVMLTTFATAVYIGLGFLPRPSRAAAMWAIAFAVAMVSSYVWVAADAAGNVTLRAIASGIELGAVAFVWSGLRARRDAPPLWQIAVAFTVVVSTALGLTADTELFSAVFRVIFMSAAVFAALAIAELVRLGPHLRDEALPLALSSAAFMIFGVISVLDGIIQLSNSGTVAADGDALEMVRELNVMGSLVYLMAALISLLLLTRAEPGDQAPVAAASRFRSVAEDRLRRAGEAHDRWWSVLDIRLDDPADLREASSTAAFLRVTESFAADVRAIMPPDADIEARGTAAFVVLLPRPEGAVRQLLSQLLERVATPTEDQPIAVRLSASIGWAGVDAHGYTLDTLLAAARTAGDRAEIAGGDRWERALVEA